ncbi:MAG TPA: DUF4190 domain-containing protein [Clostridia bacterium]|nr:DUF4190 domain-containing protein [Clostridia bacterium]
MYKIIGADGNEYGPVTLEVLRQWLAEGRINALTKVLPEGATEWKTLAEIPEFAYTAVNAAPPVGTQERLAPPPGVPRTNSLALAGFTLGLVSVTFGLCCCYGLPFNVAGVICSLIALEQIRNDPVREQGKGLAIAGLVLSGFGILLPVLFTLLGIVAELPGHFHRTFRW